MPQSERARVFAGELKKTSGGLTAKDLIRNKRGKVVSRKKSQQAGGDNNLGSWLRSKGDQFQGKPKRLKEEENDDEKLAEVRTYPQITTLVNRIDWLGSFANEVPFILAAERLMEVEAPPPAQWMGSHGQPVLTS